MRKLASIIISAMILGYTLSVPLISAEACRAVTPSPSQLVINADVIVRATAVKYVRAPAGDIRALQEPGNVEIEFKVEEILKGEKVPATIVINGYLTDKDDFNDRPVPYDFVRPGGRGGSCSAYEYKQGAEFLLFLKERDGKLTPKWAALAPTNEQLHSADDPWVVWVKDYLQSNEKKEAKIARSWLLQTFPLAQWLYQFIAHES